MTESAELSRDQIRAGITLQICPWCAAGPFKMLPVHTNKVHGIDKWELRDLAGLTTTDSLCCAEVLDAMSEAALRNGSVVVAAAANVKGRRPQRWTRAGVAKTVATLKAWEEAHPDEALAQRKANGVRGRETRWGFIARGGPDGADAKRGR